MKIQYYIISMFCLLLIGCNPRWDFDSELFEPQIVVEGWIENGQFPLVCLTQTKSLNNSIGENDLNDLAIRWAKVSVSDGTKTEILTGRINKNYIPPFIYTGSEIRGEVGKTYTLTVEYSGRTVTAETYIPQPVNLARIEVDKCEDSDTLFQIRGYFQDDKTAHNYYKVFTRTLPDDTRFFAPFLGTFNDNIISEDMSEASISIYRGVHFITTEKHTPFYKRDETVMIKFAQMSEEGFLFWSDYENEVTNKKNPIFPNSSNLRSNVKGGLGVWCGYGVSNYTVNIAEELTKKDSASKER